MAFIATGDGATDRLPDDPFCGLPGLGAVDRTAQEVEERIELVRLAMEQFAVALMRSTAFGTEATVTVPDETTAHIFRAALAEGAKKKPTHRLIDVVVEND